VTSSTWSTRRRPHRGRATCSSTPSTGGTAGTSEFPATLADGPNNATLRQLAGDKPELLLDTEWLKRAGMTWEDALSLAGSKVDKALLWAALIPSMGYMALLRNLRNFDEAGCPTRSPSRSRRDCPTRSRWPGRAVPVPLLRGVQRRRQPALGSRAGEGAQGVPGERAGVGGRTLVLVDQSPSMFPGYGFSTSQQNRDIANADLAKLFGTAVALRADDATLVGYGNTSYAVPFRRSDAVLKLMKDGFKMSDGTDTFGAIARHFAGHDRVVIVTDEQNQIGRYRSIDDVLPQQVPAYVWNIGGYAVGSTASGRSNRHTFAGMTDQAFRMIPLLENGASGTWPWETAA
jgi:hypothetical protein